MIGVMGSSREEHAELAVPLGRWIAEQGFDLLTGGGGGVMALTAGEVLVDADEPEIPVGIDSETVMVPTPVRCAVRPRALRVRVPRDRPGVRPPKPRIDWSALRALASVRSAPTAAEREEMPV